MLANVILDAIFILFVIWVIAYAGDFIMALLMVGGGILVALWFWGTLSPGDQTALIKLGWVLWSYAWPVAIAVFVGWLLEQWWRDWRRWWTEKAKATAQRDHDRGGDA